MKKGNNPRRIPRTQQDVDKAAEKGRTEGANFILTIILFILKDKHNAPDEDLETLANEIDFYCQQINDGQLSWSEVKDALKQEYDVTLKI